MQSVMTPGSATEGVGETEDRMSQMPKLVPMQVTLSLHRKFGNKARITRAASSAVLLAKNSVFGALADAS
jgi:hypothetical protein